MTLLGPFDRPVALKLLNSEVLSATPPASVIVEWPEGQSTPAQPSTPADERRLDVARFLAQALLGDSGEVVPQLARLEAVVSESIVVWSPSMYTTSRRELVAAIFDHDDAVTSTSVEIVDEVISGPRVCLEWRITGVFNNAGFLNDDVLIEPSHSEIEAAGMLVCTFEDEYVSRICCPYDRIALLEQVLSPSASDLAWR